MTDLNLARIQLEKALILTAIQEAKEAGEQVLVYDLGNCTPELEAFECWLEEKGFSGGMYFMGEETTVSLIISVNTVSVT